MHSFPHNASNVVMDSGMILILQHIGSVLSLVTNIKSLKMSGPPKTEGAGECEESDDPGPAAAALYGGVDEEDGRQLHQPAQRRARVHARAHRARS